MRQLACKKVKLETSSSIDTSSSSTSSLVLTATGGTSPATTKKSPTKKGGGGPVLTHTPVSSSLRLAKGMHIVLWASFVLKPFPGISMCQAETLKCWKEYMYLWARVHVHGYGLGFCSLL